MKISRFNLGIFADEVEQLDKMLDPLKNAAKDWMRAKDTTLDQWTINMYRNKLESEMMEFRQKIATIYDFMGDRGLVNFIPPTNGANNEVVKQEEKVVTIPTEPAQVWEELVE